MKRKKILIVYGASTNLAFVDILKRQDIHPSIATKVIKFGHHSSWNTRFWYRYFLNTLHIVKLIFKILIRAPNSQIIIFGTNPCRLLFPFLFYSKLIMVYNELPMLNKNRVLYIYDRIIFHTAYKVYLSSEERADLVKTKYMLKREIGIINNIPNLDFREINYEFADRKGFIYTGLINSSRFGDNHGKLYVLLSECKQKVDCFGWKQIGLKLNDSLFNYNGNLAQSEVLQTLERYKFALLQYSMADYNNNYCAPIKIYEYLARGCIILSVNKNHGLKELSLKYPGIILFVDDLDYNSLQHDLESIKFNPVSAKKCLQDAYSTNRKFVSDLLLMINNN